MRDLQARPMNRTSRSGGWRVLVALAGTFGCSAAAGNDPGADTEGSAGDGDGASAGEDPFNPGNASGDGDLSVPGGNGSGGAESCASDRADSEPLPVSLMILLDQSGSMTLDQPNRWDPVTSALKGFVDDDELSNMRLGLQYFPLGATTTEDPAICLQQNYQTPDVPLTEVPAASSLIVDSIDAHYFTAAEGQDAPHWGTPTRPALEGTYAYLSAWAAQNPDQTPILVLATDGKPSNLCYDDSDELDGIEEITAVISAATVGVNPIKTYVIGIGEIERLDEWALAGQTGRPAFVVDASDPLGAEEEFRAAMNEIRAAEVPCSYPIPSPNGGAIDYGKVNVEFSEPGGRAQSLAQVPGAAACGGNFDWYYDDAGSPSAIHLCPEACSAINEAGGVLDIVFGCQTVVR